MKVSGSGEAIPGVLHVDFGEVIGNRAAPDEALKEGRGREAIGTMQACARNLSC